MAGPDPNSGDDAVFSQRDSASYSLQGSATDQANLENEHYASQDSELGLHERLVRRNYSLPVGTETIPRSCPSTNSSMAMTGGSRSTYSSRSYDSPPSLSSGSSALASRSIQSFEADSAVKVGPLDEEGYQTLGESYAVQPLRCLFSDLACLRTFSSEAEWNDHSKTHFRGLSPPGKLLCAFPNCPWQSQALDGEAAWEDRANHFSQGHNVFAECHLPWRRDSAMVQYLWTMGILDNAQLQELRQFGILEMETAPYVSFQGVARHRHREGRDTRQRAQNGYRQR